MCYSPGVLAGALGEPFEIMEAGARWTPTVPKHWFGSRGGPKMFDDTLCYAFFFDQHWLAFWKGFTPRVYINGKQAGAVRLTGC